MTTNKVQARNEKAVLRWRMPLFQGILPLDRTQILPNLIAGLKLAAKNIPQAMGYIKTAGTPVITGLYPNSATVLRFSACLWFAATLHFVTCSRS
jgi:MFS superfamily sulfate permease-like transporter